jgi:hypothetical protein
MAMRAGHIAAVAHIDLQSLDTLRGERFSAEGPDRLMECPARERLRFKDDHVR